MSRLLISLIAIFSFCSSVFFGQTVGVTELLDSYRYDDALELLTDEPETEQNLLLKASCLEKLYRFGDALEIYESVLHGNPDHFEAIILAAESSTSAGDAKQALHYWTKADSLSPENQFVRIKKAMAFYRNSDWKGTIGCAKEVFQTDSLPQLLRVTGDAFLYSNQGDSAIWYYNKAIEKNPKDALAVNKLANIYYSAKFHEAAIELTDKYLTEVNVDDNPIGQLNGMANYAFGNFTKAVERLEMNIQNGDSTYSTFYFLGMSHYALNDFTKATKWLEKAYESNDSDINLLFYFGNALSFTSNQIKSIEILAEGVERVNELNEILYDFDYALGRSYVNTSNYKKGIEHYKAAYKRNSEKKIILYNIASAYDQEKDSKNALEYYRRFLKTAPKDIDFNESISEALSKGENSTQGIFYRFSHTRIKILEERMFFESGIQNY